MHELAVASELLDLVLRVAAENGATRVTAIDLRLGVASCLEPDALSFGFEALARDTPASGAGLAIARIPAPATCPQCSWRGEVEALNRMECPCCGASPVTLRGGRELQVQTITVE